MKWFAIAGFVSLPILALWVVFMPHTSSREPKEVARVRLACGELLLTQTFTRTVEPYIVRLYFREHGKPVWTQYWVDDEAPYWWGGLVPHGGRAELTLYGGIEGFFECGAQAFTLRGRMIPPARQVRNPFDISQTQRRPLP